MRASKTCMVLNRGASLRDADPGIGRAVLLTGNPRGGTTFLGSTAHHLGIPIGFKRPRYEDPELRALLRGETPDPAHILLAKAIRTREERGTIWGWKLPAMSRHLDIVDRLVRKPIYVMVIRDPLSIALRRPLESNTKFIKQMRGVVNFLEPMLDFVSKTDRECILVSYEKATRNPGDFIKTLADVVGLPVDDEKVNQIAAAVNSDNQLYDRRARLQVKSRTEAAEFMLN